MDKHIYPPQKKIGYEPMSISVPAGFKDAMTEYKQWLIDNDLDKSPGNGRIMASLALENNDKLREIFIRIEKGKKRHGKHYLDPIKTTKAGKRTS